MNTYKYILIIILSGTLSVTAQQLSYPVFTNGSGRFNSDANGLLGITGQPLTGVASSENFTINSGYAFIGNPLITSVDNTSELLPDKYELKQNYPNPFNPSTVIEYNVKERSRVIIKVYDVLGQVVMTPVNDFYESGKYRLNLQMNGFSTGVYFYRIEMGSFTKSRKMILMR